ATVLDGGVEEVTGDGRVVWSWLTRGHIGLAETGRWYHRGVLGALIPRADGRRAYDVVHVNSAEPHAGRILLSTRHTDALYDIDRSTGEVVWKLGGTKTPQSLRVIGLADAHPFGGQHDARVLSDGTITVHDNGTFLHRRPRALRFAIDESSR